MATKANIAYRQAEAIKTIELNMPGVFDKLPKTYDSDTRFMLQLEALAEKLDGKPDAGKSADEPKAEAEAEAEVKESPAQPKRKRKSKK